MKAAPALAGFAHGGRGINERTVAGLVFMPNCHARISQAKAELCEIIDSKNKNDAETISIYCER
jgi:hypothetical protein